MNFTVTKGITFSNEIIEPNKLNMAVPNITLTENQVNHDQISGTSFQPLQVNLGTSGTQTLTVRDDFPICFFKLAALTGNVTLQFSGEPIGGLFGVLFIQTSASYTVTLPSAYTNYTNDGSGAITITTPGNWHVVRFWKRGPSYIYWFRQAMVSV